MEKLDDLDLDTQIGSYTVRQIKSILSGSPDDQRELRVHLTELLKQLRSGAKKRVRGGDQLGDGEKIAIILVVLGLLAALSNGNLRDNQVAGTRKPALDGNFYNLLATQTQEFPLILESQLINHKKSGCWMWWVFPHATVGTKDWKKLTGVPVDKIAELFQDHDDGSRLANWKRIFARIQEFHGPEHTLADIFPRRDHPRLSQFINFWGDQVEKDRSRDTPIIPVWFKDFLGFLLSNVNEIRVGGGAFVDASMVMMGVVIVLIAVMWILFTSLHVKDFPGSVSIVRPNTWIDQHTCT